MKLFTSTRVEWADEASCPEPDSNVLEGAHVTWHGDRLVISRTGESGRKEAIDTIYQATLKGGNTENATVTGVSQFMVDRIGLPPEDAEVTVRVDMRPSRCLNC